MLPEREVSYPRSDMLERVALHQTRLRTPGLSLDARGVAIGTHGLLLFSSLDRLVAFFALYTQSQTLDDLVTSLRIELVRSKLGVREVALIFQSDSSDRMDAMAEVAALAGGHTFIGGGRYWVQYRDAAAPFGYDVSEVRPESAHYQLHHQAYSQSYEIERPIELRQLLLRLRPHIDPSAGREPGPRWLLAEWGLGGALIHYLRRSEVEAKVALCEWPPLSALEDVPVRRYLFDIPSLPARMVSLLTRTPGLSLFVPVSSGAAVQMGHRHPVQLRAVPAFRAPSLVLFRAGGEAPLEVKKLPAFGPLEAFARVSVLSDDTTIFISERSIDVPQLRVPLRLVPSARAHVDVSATWVEPGDYPLLRKLLYSLGNDTLRKSSIAITREGALVRVPEVGQLLPLGTYCRAAAPSVYVPAGYDTAPAVTAEVLVSALDMPSNSVMLLRPNAPPWVIGEAAFLSLEAAILEGPRWVRLEAESLDAELATELPRITLAVEDPGSSPMRDVERVKEAE